MRVLLDAKTHKIEELTTALNELKESSDRDIRILNHQLRMTQGMRFDVRKRLQILNLPKQHERGCYVFDA